MPTPFTLIIPKQITDSNFSSSNVPENDYAAWSSSTTYTLGQYVILGAPYHKVYQSVNGTGNLNKNPATESTYWVEVSPTNRWKMFDQSGGTITTNPDSIVVTFTASKLTAIAFLDVTCASIQVTGSYAGTTFYDVTQYGTDQAIINNWYDYFTAESSRSSVLVFLNVPYVSNATFTVTISNPGTTAACGNMVWGVYQELGKTQYGATVGITDYSKKNVDEFGKVTLVQRAFSQKMDAKLYVENTAVDPLRKTLTGIRATPCLWLGAPDNFESTTLYGYYKDFSIDIAYPTYSVCSLSLEGLT